MGPFLDPVFDHPKKSEFSTFAIAPPDFPENHTFFTFFPVFAKNSVFFVFFGFLPFSGIVLTPFFVKNGQKPSKTGQKGGPKPGQILAKTCQKGSKTRFLPFSDHLLQDCKFPESFGLQFNISQKWIHLF